MLRTLGWLLVFVGGSLAAPAAHAHITLKAPARRPAGDIKIGPCGGAAKGASPTVFEPGATISVTWDETIQHPGHYRIAFDTDGDDFPEPTSYDDVKSPLPFDLGNGASVLADDIMDMTGPFIGNTPYEQSITLPDVECETCTLQVIQVMTEKVPYTVNGDDVYHECADIALRRTGATPDAGVVLPPPDAGAPPVAGMVAPPPPPVAGMVAMPTGGVGGIAGMTAGTGVTGGAAAPLPPIAGTPAMNGSSDGGGCTAPPGAAPPGIGATLPLLLALLAMRLRASRRSLRSWS